MVTRVVVAHRTRYLSMKKKTKQEVLDKQAAELSTARRDFEEARFSVTKKLVVVDCRKRYEFLDSLGSSMEAHMHFFRRGNDLFNVGAPHLDPPLLFVLFAQGHSLSLHATSDGIVCVVA
jgi:Arf-GAP/coiled-coil/ANK repeat/PH domain-containing protein